MTLSLKSIAVTVTLSALTLSALGCAGATDEQTEDTTASLGTSSAALAESSCTVAPVNAILNVGAAYAASVTSADAGYGSTDCSGHELVKLQNTSGQVFTAYARWVDGLPSNQTACERSAVRFTPFLRVFTTSNAEFHWSTGTERISQGRWGLYVDGNGQARFGCSVPDATLAVADNASFRVTEVRIAARAEGPAAPPFDALILPRRVTVGFRR